MTTPKGTRKPQKTTPSRPRGSDAKDKAHRALLKDLGWLPPAPPSGEAFQRAEEAKREVIQSLFGKLPKKTVARSLTHHIPAGSNVVGIGFGLKEVGAGGFGDKDTVRVYVSKKAPRSRLRAAEIIPSYVNGFPTDVLEIGMVQPHQAGSFQPCGGSVSSLDSHDGTLGCLVQRRGLPEVYILSCNHVLAYLNQDPGPPIFAPGLKEGGNPATPIARLTAAPKLAFDGTPNYMDAALAQLTVAGSVAPEILGIGRVQQPPMTASQTQSVRKHGFETMTTLGVVLGFSDDVPVTFDADHAAHFAGQIVIQGVGATPFSAGGDSGSLVLDAASGQPVGMIIAGVGPYSVASHISAILGSALEIL